MSSGYMRSEHNTVGFNESSYASISGEIMISQTRGC